MTKKVYKTVKVEKENGITWVILNRPEKRNAMTTRFFRECGRQSERQDEKRGDGSDNHSGSRPVLPPRRGIGISCILRSSGISNVP